MMLEIVEKDIDIALISEPYLYKSCMVKIPPGYVAYAADEDGLAAIIVKKRISHFALKFYFSIWMIPVVIKVKDTRIVFVSLYCARQMAAVPHMLQYFFESQSVMYKNIIIGGDVNSHSCLVGYAKSDKRGCEWDDFVAKNDLVVHNIPNEVTFLNSRGHSSTIDLTLSTHGISESIQDWKVNSDPALVSDHHAIEFTLKVQATNAVVKKRIFKSVNWDDYRESLKCSIERSQDSELSTTSLATKFEEAVQQTTEKIVPWSTIRQTRTEWWSKSLDIKRRELRKAKRKHWNNFRTLKEDYEKAILEARQSHWEKFISNVGSSDDAYLRYKILCKGKSNIDLGPIRINNESLTNSAEESAQILLERNFPDETESMRNTHVHRQVRHWSSIPFISSEPQITAEEIISAVEMGENKSSAGDDGTPIVVYKKCLEELLPTLINLFNASLNEGEVPQFWKIAKIIFLKKPNKSDYTNPKSRRPISLLHVLSKVMERIITDRISFFSRRNKYLDDQQFGFQRGVSAEHAALKLANHLVANFKRKKETIVVFLDVVNAFPSVWHDGLIYKLYKIGVPKVYIRWITSFLSDRKVKVLIDEKSSVCKSVSRGLPQGAVSSPLLWSLFMNDIFDEVRSEGVHCLAFADDVAIWAEGDPGNPTHIGRIQKSLEKITEWASKWHVEFSKEKTKAVRFSRLRKRSEPAFTFKGSDLQISEQHVYLGIVFDSKLTWKPHIRDRTARATKTICQLNAVARRRFGLPGKTHKFIYQRAIIPLITYGAIVWGYAIDQNENTKMLTRVNRIASLGCTGLLRTTATSTVQVIAGLKPLVNRLYEIIGMSFFNIESNPDLRDRLHWDYYNEVHLETTTHKSPIHYASCCACITTAGLTQKRRPGDRDHPAINKRPTTVIQDREKAIQSASVSMPGTIKIYTDASKQGESKVGCAAVMEIDGIFRNIASDSLHKYESVFRGELWAMHIALNYLYSNLGSLKHQQVTIFSDSKSSLQALNNSRSLESDIFSIQKQAQFIAEKGIHIKFQWVPGHEGVKGNELADELAKQATEVELDETITNKMTKCRLRRGLIKETITEWQKQWDISKDGRHTYSLFSKVSEDIAFETYDNIRRHDKTNLRRALAGHFPCRSYLNRFHLDQTDECRLCAKESETIEHVILNCPSQLERKVNFFRMKGLNPWIDRQLMEYFTNEKVIPLTIEILSCVVRLNLKVNQNNEMTSKKPNL